MISIAYRAQVDLLLRVLPYVASENVFALKGGTAINLFVRDMPRFSVDIDLTYLPFDTRDQALLNIAEALRRIKDRLKSATPCIDATITAQGGGEEAKVICQSGDATIKIEVNTLNRGQLWTTRTIEVVPAVQEEFGKSAVATIVSDGELYGGKLCAALDRQHPRDLFDVRELLANEGITDQIRLGFLASLLSHSRPIHEVLRPTFSDRRDLFAAHFDGMAIAPFTYEDFETTREQLVEMIHVQLTESDRAFLLSFKQGQPDWSLFPVENLQKMPAVQWKLANILELKRNPSKHAAQLRSLEDALART